MNTRPRYRLASAVVGALLLVSLVSRVWCAENGLRGDRFERIAPGMTATEVEALLGPPGDYRTDSARFSVSHHSLWQVAIGDGSRHEVWYADTGKLEVRFDAEGRVASRRMCPSQDLRPPVWQRWFGGL